MRNLRMWVWWLGPVTIMHCAAEVLAQGAPDPLWLRQFGTNSSEYTQGIAGDVDGVYVSGRTSGNLAGPHQGYSDIFLARYDKSGNQAWIVQFGTTERDNTRSAAPDGEGGVYIGGYSAGNIGGAGGAPVGGWVARYDNHGNQLWIRQPWAARGTHVNAVATAESGGVFLTGRTDGEVGGPSAGGSDVIVAHFNDNGDLVWVRQFGGTADEAGHAASPDGAGGFYAAGSTRSHLARPVVGLRDVWLARYDRFGNQLWLRQFGDTISESVTGLAFDGMGGVFIGGSISLHPSPGEWIYGARVARFNGEGELLWERVHTSGTREIAWDVAPDGSGGVYITGSTRANLPGTDVFLARYNSAGDKLWITHFGTASHELGNALAYDYAGGTYVAGNTRGNLGNLSPPPPNTTHAFVARFPSGDPEPCYANCDGSTVEPVLTVDDFTCFINEFAQAQMLPHAQQVEHYANCDGSTEPPVLTVDDFTCFIGAFAAGCP